MNNFTKLAWGSHTRFSDKKKEVSQVRELYLRLFYSKIPRRSSSTTTLSFKVALEFRRGSCDYYFRAEVVAVFSVVRKKLPQRNSWI